MEYISIDKRFAGKLREALDVLIMNADELEAEEIWLFGSLARGTATLDSDIDLLVVTQRNRKNTSLKVWDLDVRDDVGFPKVDVVVRTKKELESKLYPFNEEVSKDKVVLWRRSAM